MTLDTSAPARDPFIIISLIFRVGLKTDICQYIYESYEIHLISFKCRVIILQLACEKLGFGFPHCSLTAGSSTYRLGGLGQRIRWWSDPGKLTKTRI